MPNLLVLNTDDQPFTVESLERIFQSDNRFRDVRFNEPGGAVIEADYVDVDDSTIVGLSGTLKAVSLSGDSDAALRVALILQRHLQAPLRIIDTDYTFDLTLSDFKDVKALQTAIISSQAK